MCSSPNSLRNPVFKHCVALVGTDARISSRSLQTEDTPGVCAAAARLLSSLLLADCWKCRRDDVDLGDLGVKPHIPVGDAPAEAALQDDGAELGAEGCRAEGGAFEATASAKPSLQAGAGIRSFGTDGI
mmetsp:Transcript_25589/g.51636  ORF Transcript_25589/g.51636 Transcript_25589/m.51636 type:complete len:129 (+) Transcript_25589:578-964(+)